MVGHKTVRVTDPVIAFVYMLERIEKFLTIKVVFEDGFFPVSPGRNMVDGAGVFYAEGTGHAATIAEGAGNVKPQDLTL